MTNHIDIIRDILKVFWSISFAHRLLEFLDVTEEYSSIVSIEGWKHLAYQEYADNVEKEVEDEKVGR